ncbi:MAG: DUF2431 domain-containing protein [Nanoarchaeota archaeon]|nr:DUF2431 domain-containing protein [Nanoarchaeota archaeon]
MYEPVEDSFLIKKYIKNYAKGKILDLGTGLGILAKEALNYSKDVLAADINQESVNYLKKLNIKAVRSDLFENIKDKFDLIIFNPPYLPEDKREPKETALATTGGKYGYEILERFFKHAKNYLNKNGKIIIVFSSLTNKKKINKLIKENNFKFKLLEKKKIDFEELYCYLIY